MNEISVGAVLRLHVHVVSARQDLDLGHVAIGGCAARRGGHHGSVLVHELKVVAAQQVRNRGQLGAVSGGIIIELEQGNGKELHVLRNAQNLCNHRVSWLRSRDLRKDENLLEFGS